MKRKKWNHMYMIEKIRYDRVEKRHRYVRDPEGYLFADGLYPTKIRPEDLPAWYVYGRYYKCFGYISAKDVKHMVYVPNKTFNHMFKDDMLYISYQEEIVEVPEQCFPRYQGFDFYICGSAIVDFLKAAEQYSGYDISTIKAQIEDKRLWFKATFPEFYALEVSRDKPFFDGGQDE